MRESHLLYGNPIKLLFMLNFLAFFFMCTGYTTSMRIESF